MTGRVPFPGLDVLAYEPSPIGMICLRRRELLSAPGTLITEITVDHEMLMSSANVASEEALATSGVAWHGGRGLSVLVGGLGLGHTARQVLASDRVAELRVIEFLPQVIDWLQRDLLPLSGDLKGDARFAIEQGDVYGQLREAPPRTWDLVLIDVDHSPEESLHDENVPFYTERGLSLAREHLADGGVLGVWSYAESPDFEAALRRVFAEVRVEPVSFRNRLVDEDETNWLFFARG